MVIDESTAKAHLKIQTKIFKRRIMNINNKQFEAKKSRKRWKRDILKDMKKTSVVFKLRDKDDSVFAALIPSDSGHEGFFDLDIIEMDCKKCHAEIHGTKVTFSQHMLVWMMQAYKTTVLHEMNYYFSVILNSVIVNLENLKEGIYDLYVKDVGVCVLCIEDGGLCTVKTVVHLNSIIAESKRGKNYLSMINADCNCSIEQLKEK